MKYMIFLSFLLNSLFSIAQVERCDYIPIDFEEIAPLWRHLTIDTTILSFKDTSAAFRTCYTNPFEHLSTEASSFIEGDYLYSLVEIDIDLDVSGAVAEKINLQTGELEWQIIEDIRSAPYREQVLHAAVEGDRFVIYGARDFAPDSTDTSSFIYDFKLSFAGIYYRREYNIETGDRILEFTPADDDSLAAWVVKDPIVSYNFFSEDSLISLFDKRNFLVGKGYNLTRTVIDPNGHLVGVEDTVVVGRFSDREILGGLIQDEPKLLLTPENTYLYLENYYPREDDGQTFEAIFSEYDKDFNLLRELDLKTLGLDIFSQVEPLEVTEDAILIRGCANRYNGIFASPCEEFYFVLDRSFNLVHQFTIPDSEISLEKTLSSGIRLASQEKVYILDALFQDVGQSFLDLYESVEGGTIRLVKRLTISESEWVGFVDKFFILDGGDFLIRFTHSCFIDGDKNSWHPEWFRFDINDLLESVSTEEISSSLDIRMSPNPVSDYLFLQSEEPFSGHMEIRDTGGRVLLSKQMTFSNEWQIPVSDYEHGLYHLVVTQDNGQRQVRKFVKM